MRARRAWKVVFLLVQSVSLFDAVFAFFFLLVPFSFSVPRAFAEQVRRLIGKRGR